MRQARQGRRPDLCVALRRSLFLVLCVAGPWQPACSIKKLGAHRDPPSSPQFEPLVVLTSMLGHANIDAPFVSFARCARFLGARSLSWDSRRRETRRPVGRGAARARRGRSRRRGRRHAGPCLFQRQRSVPAGRGVPRTVRPSTRTRRSTDGASCPSRPASMQENSSCSAGTRRRSGGCGG